jgi:hypothetical protein
MGPHHTDPVVCGAIGLLLLAHQYLTMIPTIFEKRDFKVIMPRSWTPKRYLGAQDVSWGTLPVHNDEFPPHYTTMNELNWLLPLQKDIVHMQLVTSASYLHLYSGEFNKIEYQFIDSAERRRRLWYKLYTNVPLMLPRKYFLLPDTYR